MDVAKLQAFVVVAEELHFRRAAERLFMSQPPLSRLIKSLERELDTRLFDRSTRRVALTSEGEAFLRRARRIIEQYEGALDDITALRAGATDFLRLGFVGSAALRLMPEALAAYRHNEPTVQVELREMSGEQQVHALKAGDLDVGINRGHTNDPAVSTVAVATEQLVVGVPSDHPVAGLQSVDLADLSDEPFIMCPRPRAPAMFDLVVQACRQHGFTPRIVQESATIMTAVALVRTGLGISIVPEALSELHLDGIQYVAIANPPSCTLMASFDASSLPAQRFVRAIPTADPSVDGIDR